MGIPAGVSPDAVRFDADLEIGGVMVATPCYGGACHDAYVQGMVELARLCAERGIPLTLATSRNESLVQRGRNTLTAHFLASTCLHLVFIDSDIGFTGGAVLRLLAHDRDIIGGIYRKKTLAQVDWVMNAHPSPDDTAERDPRTGAVRVNHIGTGFLSIRRRVVQTLYDQHPEWHYAMAEHEGSGAWKNWTSAIFDCWIDPETRQYLSEDYGFCVRAQQAGFEVWMDPGIVLEHHGNACFVADPVCAFR